jgi:hypothetical protein
MNNWCIFWFFTQLHSKIPSKNLVRQRCAEGFNSGVKGLTHNLQYQVMTKPNFGFRKFYFTNKNTSEFRILAYSIISVLRFGGYLLKNWFSDVLNFTDSIFYLNLYRNRIP